MDRPVRSRVLTATGWALTVALAVALGYQRYAEAIAGGPGADLGAWLDASELARSSGDIYDARGYTYSPLIAWLLLVFPDPVSAMAGWTALSLALGALAVGLVVVAHRAILPGWRAPLVAAVGVTTVFYSRVLSIELFLGQNQLLLLTLLAAAAAAATRWPALSGVLVALVALVKTWPALIAVWLLRRGNKKRLRSVVAAIATVVAVVALMIVVLGPSSIGRLVERTLSLSEQTVPVYSVWYFARHWPPGEQPPVRFSDGPLLGQLVTIALLLGALALIALAVLRPGTPSLAIWNIAAATTLVIPVSHAFYRLLALPLLWVWLAELIGRRPRRGAAIVFAALAVWWIVGFRWADAVVGSGWPHATVVVATLAVVALSTMLASARTPDTRGGHTLEDVPLWGIQDAKGTT